MLAIRLAPGREWWVRGRIFERLFQSALDGGELAPELEEWRHVADANGGFALTSMAPADAARLASALRDAATRDLERLGDARSGPDDDAYRGGLREYLRLSTPT